MGLALSPRSPLPSPPIAPALMAAASTTSLSTSTSSSSPSRSGDRFSSSSAPSASFLAASTTTTTTTTTMTGAIPPSLLSSPAFASSPSPQDTPSQAENPPPPPHSFYSPSLAAALASLAAASAAATATAPVPVPVRSLADLPQPALIRSARWSHSPPPLASLSWMRHRPMTLHPSPSPAESIPDQDCDDGDDDDDDEIKDDHPRQSPPFANLSSVSSPFPGRSARPLALAPVPMMAPPPPPPRDPLSVLPRPHFEPVRLSIRTPDVFFSDDDEGEDGGEGQRNRPSEDVFFPPPRPVSLLARRPPSTPDSDALLSAEPLAGARSSLPPPLAHPRPVIVTRPNVSASFGTISTHQAPPTAARSLTDPLSPATLQTFSALMDSLQSSVLSDNHSEEEVDDDSSAVPHEAITTTIPPHLLIPQLPFSLSNSASPRQSSAAGPSPPAASFQGVAGQPAFRSRYDILMHLRPQRGPAAALNTQGTPGAQPQRLHQHGNHHNHTHLNQHHHHHQHLQHHHHHQHLHQPQQQHHHQHRQHQQHHHQRVQHPSRSLGQRSQVSDMPHEISTSEARANRMLQSVGPELAASFLVGFRAKLAELEREMYDANGVVDWVGDSVGALLRRRAARCGEECDEEREQQQEPNKEDQARERSGGGGDGHAGIGSGASAFAATGEQGEPCARLQETSRRSRMRTTRMGSDSVNGGGFGGGGCSNQYGDGDGAGEFFEFDMWSGRRRTAEWKIEWLLQRHKDLRGMKREWRELSAACDEIEWLLVRSSARLDR